MSDERSSETERFSEKMAAILNLGSLNLTMGMGYRLGLFDVMDALAEPATAEAVARSAGLDARYVREWLGAMACGGIVTLSVGADGTDRFFLPPAHAALITRKAGSANLGVYTQEIPLLTQCAMEAVVAGFKTGDGVAYENYPRFQQFMAQLADAKHRQVLVDVFLPSVAGGEVVRRMRQGIRVCDLGCATGVALTLMAEAFPRSDFIGIDLDPEVIDAARETAARKHLGNIAFKVQDASTLAENAEFASAFDYVTAFDAIHDQTKPLDALRGVHAALKPGGAFSMVDIAAGSALADNLDHPMGPFLYTVSLMHCMPVGLVDGGTGLGMMWGKEKAVSMLKQAGFARVDVAEIPQDAFNLHFYCVKGG